MRLYSRPLPWYWVGSYTRNSRKTAAARVRAPKSLLIFDFQCPPVQPAMMTAELQQTSRYRKLSFSSMVKLISINLDNCTQRPAPAAQLYRHHPSQKSPSFRQQANWCCVELRVWSLNGALADMPGRSDNLTINHHPGGNSHTGWRWGKYGNLATMQGYLI